MRESGAAVKVTSKFLFPISLGFSWGHEYSQSEAGRKGMESPRGVDRQEESGKPQHAALHGPAMRETGIS